MFQATFKTSVSPVASNPTRVPPDSRRDAMPHKSFIYLHFLLSRYVDARQAITTSFRGKRQQSGILAGIFNRNFETVVPAERFGAENHAYIVTFQLQKLLIIKFNELFRLHFLCRTKIAIDNSTINNSSNVDARRQVS